MKVLLTGATGLLGGAISDQAASMAWSCDPLDRQAIWQSSSHLLADKIAHYDVLVHAAANTNVEACETAPDVCYRDNFLLTEMLCAASRKAEIPMVFVSSTGVYGTGRDEPYRDFDQVNPTTHHHRSKVLAEESVLRSNAANLVIRTGWLFGGDVANPKNFVARRIEEGNKALAERKVISANSVQFGVPSFNQDVARRILLLVQDARAGIFNCVNEGTASRYEYVRAILQFAKVDVDVIPVDASTFNRRAMVSPNEMATNWKMHSLGYPALPAWKDSLATYVEQYLGNK